MLGFHNGGSLADSERPAGTDAMDVLRVSRHAIVVGAIRRHRRLLALVVGLTACCGFDSRATGARSSSPTPSAQQTADGRVAEGSELVGKPAVAWDVTEWIGSPPLTVASLRGKVVLVRWFTSTDCPYCSATAPALNLLHHDYAGRGLVVIGMYHHKRLEPLDRVSVRGWMREYGFEFPVGVDHDWRTLKQWWLDGHKRELTSVSFLLDRQGIIRHIHAGGRMALGMPDFAAMRSNIEQLLAE